MYKRISYLCLLWTFAAGLLPSAHAMKDQITPNIPKPPLPVNCSFHNCGYADQRMIEGNLMFDESNFAAQIDGLGRTRKFWVRIPENYDQIDGINEQIPVVFAFHGISQSREPMLHGKWEDHFDEKVAFVIPLGEPIPCNGGMGNGWMVPAYWPVTSPDDADCNLATLHTATLGSATYDARYWDASNHHTFTDVNFIESLRTTLLDRFPKLNPNKVYATGFSLGGGMTYTLLCYRSGSYRGFSVVAATLEGHLQRGDLHYLDGLEEYDPNSLTETCGKTVFDGNHATGISYPHLWGVGFTGKLPYPAPPGGYASRVTRPLQVIVGDQDILYESIDIENSRFEIAERNNLSAVPGYIPQYLDTQSDNATTQLRVYAGTANSAEPASVFQELLVMGQPGINPGDPPLSGSHAAPDTDVCGSGYFFMTCDYDYTAETLSFFEEYAELNLAPGDLLDRLPLDRKTVSVTRQIP